MNANGAHIFPPIVLNYKWLMIQDDTTFAHVLGKGKDDLKYVHLEQVPKEKRREAKVGP